jgi:hypothetical protein
VIKVRFGREAAAVEAGPANKDPLVTRHAVTEEGVRFSFRVPTVGWERFSSISTDKSAGGPISINKSIVGPQGAEAIIFWTSFPDGDYADPCARLLKPSVGSSAADLAAAVSAAPGTELRTGPSNVTVGGRPAKHVALTVRENVGCDPGFFYAWRDVYGGALWPKTGVGDTIGVWIVDVHGMPLFIEAETTKGVSRDLEREVQQIVESLRFE